MQELKILVLSTVDVTDNMYPLRTVNTLEGKRAVEQADIVVFNGIVYKNRYGGVVGHPLRLK